MNTDQIQGSWKEISGKVQEKWGRLTNDDLDRIAGQKDQLVGAVQKEYGKSREAAEKEVDDYLRGL